jgi:hypothetical protein
MNAAFVFHERDREQNEYHDKHNTLFVLREFKNPEQALHFVAFQFSVWNPGLLMRPVMLSEAKHLWFLLGPAD